MHDDEQRIVIPVRKVRQYVPVSDDLRELAEMNLKLSERLTREATEWLLARERAVNERQG
jgi:hypothetical protein